MTPRTFLLTALVALAAAGCGGDDGDRPAASRTGAADGPEEAVVVHLAVGPAGLDYPLLQGLEDRLAAAIETRGVGEYDGNAIGPGEAILYAYGPDADALFDVMQPILESFPPTVGSYAVKRYGTADDPGAREVRVDLDAAG